MTVDKCEHFVGMLWGKPFYVDDELPEDTTKVWGVPGPGCPVCARAQSVDVNPVCYFEVPPEKEPDPLLDLLQREEEWAIGY